MAEPTSVYLYFDKLGVLLYVGITKRGITRQDEHTLKEWWPFVAKQEIEHYDSREVAAARETMLIKERRPPFNKQQNRDHARLREAYLTLFSERTPLLPADERCGHCGPCLDEDGPCMVNPSSSVHEPSLACDCGDPLCPYQAGREAGSQEGWSLGLDFCPRKIREFVSNMAAGKSLEGEDLQADAVALVEAARKFSLHCWELGGETMAKAIAAHFVSLEEGERLGLWSLGGDKAGAPV